MSDNEILECAQTVHDFLTDNSEHNLYKSINDIPSLKNMNTTLSKYNTDMLPFTNFLNSKYNISDNLWVKSPKEFFSSTKSHNFYKRIIRKLKIELCLD